MQYLVKKAQHGDADAFVSLIESCKASMYRVAKGYFSDENDVADAISETVLSAYEHLPELKKSAYFKTWLTRILINRCNQMLKERRRMQPMEFLPEEQSTDAEYTNVELRHLLAEFPEDCQMILLLYYAEGFKTREIAEILNTSENTIKSKLRRTRAKLHDELLCKA